MIKIVYKNHDGSAQEVECPTGISAMEAAVNNGIAGIDGDCGGVCACATCHVYIDSAWMALVGPPGENEDVMLDLTESRQENSRLACQISLDETLDGLVLRLPESQH